MNEVVNFIIVQYRRIVNSKKLIEIIDNKKEIRKGPLKQERGTASEPFPIDWHLAGVPLPAFLLAQWACSSTISTSNAILSYAHYSRFIPLCKELDSFASIF